MLYITREHHAKTQENIDSVVGGHKDVPLLAQHLQPENTFHASHTVSNYDLIVTSDLQRAIHTPALIFPNTTLPQTLSDKRLRGIDFGEYEGRPKSVVGKVKHQHITEPFPGGESYTDVVVRMRDLLDDLKKDHDGKRVLMIGHGGTALALEHITNNKELVLFFNPENPLLPGWKFEF